jgi:hypothetical protein
MGTALNSSPRFSILVSAPRSARFSASHVKGCRSTSRASRTRKPPFARWSAPALISRKSVTIVPNDARYSIRPIRL